MTVLLLAEHDNRSLDPVTRSALTAACQLESDIDILVVGDACRSVAESASRLAGASRVLLVEAAHFHEPTAENVASQVAALASGYTHVLAAATSTGKNVMPRVAAMLDVAQISEVIAVLGPGTFSRPIYAGNATQTVQSVDPVKVMTVRATAFAASGDGGAAPIESVEAVADCGLSRVVGRELTRSGRPELGAADVVVAGGRGLGSRENFIALLEPLAQKLDAAIGATRAAVDAGFVSNDLQIGQTGKVVAPRLYIAVGLSGAIQHLAGMKDSQVIVAINKDPEAPIFQIADFGLVGDLFELVPALIDALG